MRRDALTALCDAFDRRSQLYRPQYYLTNGAATVVPQWGPRGGRKLRSSVDHRMVEAPESARNDNARRDRIAICGAAAVSAAHHHACLEEYDTAKPEFIAVRLTQRAHCTCNDWRQTSVDLVAGKHLAGSRGWSSARQARRSAMGEFMSPLGSPARSSST